MYGRKSCRVAHDRMEIKRGEKKKKKKKERIGKERRGEERKFTLTLVFIYHKINSPGQLCILFECNTITLGSQY